MVCGDPLFYTLLYAHLLGDGQAGAAVDSTENGGQGQGQGLEQGQGHGSRRGAGRGMERGRMNIFLALQPRPQAEEYLRGKDPCLLHRHVRFMTRLYLPSILPYLTLPHVTLPYLTLPNLTLPYLTLPYLTLPKHTHILT